MLFFKKNLKIYLFKDKKKVNFSIKVSDMCVNTYELSVLDFEKILEKWNTTGVSESFDHCWWTVCYKKKHVENEESPVNYVRISVLKNNQHFHYRVNYSDMIEIANEYLHQKNNVMYWDKNV